MKELKSVERLIESFRRLPGVGYKSAEKMAYSVLEMKDEDAQEFSDALIGIKKSIHKCKICGSLTENDICDVCKNDSRDKKQILVVSYPKDVIAFEKLNDFNGVYHVLGGVLSAMNGVGIDDLNIASLIQRIRENKAEEIIVATNPTTEGETTALYLARLLSKENVNVTRLAYGLPMGGYLEYADTLTLSKALEGRKKL